MVTAGVLARHAEDLIPVLKVLIGINRDKLKLSQPVVLSDVRVFYVTDPRDPLVSPFRKEMNDCLWKTVSYFRDICKDVPQAIELKQFRYTAKLWRYWMTQEQMIFKNDLNDQKGELNAIPEIIKHFLFLSNDFTTGSIYNLIQNYLPKVDDKWAKQETENLKKALIVSHNRINIFRFHIIFI